jgi:hypothetical protein
VPKADAEAFFREVRDGFEAPGFTFTLFPDQTYPKNRNLTVHPSVELTKQEVHAATGGNPAAYMSLYLAACIDYSFPSDMGSRHQTSFILEVEKAGGPISPADGVISQASLTLRDTGVGGMDHAD